MTKHLVLLLIAALTGCASIDRVPTDYAGSDAGRVVVGIGAATGTSYSSYSLLFRKKGAASSSSDRPSIGRFVYFQTNTFYKQAPDYQSADEAGVVLVQSLPPGEYEIYNFDIFFNAGTVQNNYSSRAEFSIPFTVKPGEMTYLGNYQANRLTGKNFLGLSLPAGAVFVVSDRLNSELRIAEAKTKSTYGAASNKAPTPSSIGNPFFQSPQAKGSFN
jgi:hypothetical protein